MSATSETNADEGFFESFLWRCLPSSFVVVVVVDAAAVVVIAFESSSNSSSVGISGDITAIAFNELLDNVVGIGGAVAIDVASIDDVPRVDDTGEGAPDGRSTGATVFVVVVVVAPAACDDGGCSSISIST